MILSAAILLTLAGVASPAPMCTVGDSVLIQEWKVPWDKTRPRDPSVDKQGRVWFVGQTGDYIGMLDPKTGQFKKYDLEKGTGPHNQILDADGNVWYSGNRVGHIGKLDPRTGQISKFQIPDPSIRDPHTLIFDKQGENIWWTAQNSNAVGRFSPRTGKFDVIKLTDGSKPYGIVIDSKGHPWFNEFGANRIGTIDPTSLKVKEYPLPNDRARDRRIAVTSDDMIWYGDYTRGYLGRLDPRTGKVDEWPLPGGPLSQPYGLTSDDKDRIWVAEMARQPAGGQMGKIRLVGFDPKDCDYFSTTWVPSGGGTVRYIVFHKPTRELWFGTDENTIARAKVP